MDATLGAVFGKDPYCGVLKHSYVAYTTRDILTYLRDKKISYGPDPVILRMKGIARSTKYQLLGFS